MFGWPARNWKAGFEEFQFGRFLRLFVGGTAGSTSWYTVRTQIAGFYDCKAATTKSGFIIVWSNYSKEAIQSNTERCGILIILWIELKFWRWLYSLNFFQVEVHCGFEREILRGFRYIFTWLLTQEKFQSVNLIIYCWDWTLEIFITQSRATSVYFIQRKTITPSTMGTTAANLEAQRKKKGEF